VTVRYQIQRHLLCISVLIASPFFCYAMPSSTHLTPHNKIKRKSSRDITKQLAKIKKESVFEEGFLSPFMTTWDKLTANLDSKTQLKLGIAYTAVYQGASRGSPHRHAASGDFDLIGSWTLYRDNDKTGILGFNLEQRHALSSIPPAKLSESIPTISNTTRAFNTQAFFPVLLWYQYGDTETAGFRFGKIDVSTIMNVHAYDSQNHFFLNESFSGDPATGVPANGLGIVAGTKLSKRAYVIVGIADANAVRTSLGFDTLFHYHEFFYAVELGLTTDILKHEADNIHIMFWHSDPQSAKEKAGDSGLGFVAQKNITSRALIFTTISINTGNSLPYKKTITGGIVIKRPFMQPFSLIGLALSYGQSREHTIKNEFISELFYRIQLTPYSQLTPDIQLITNQQYPDFCHHLVWVPGIRYRIKM